MEASEKIMKVKEDKEKPKTTYDKTLINGENKTFTSLEVIT